MPRTARHSLLNFTSPFVTEAYCCHTRKNKVGGDGKVLRTSSGGGTRKINVSKDADNKMILKEGRTLFFAEKKSKKGHWDGFIVTVLDYQRSVMPDGITVGDIYEVTTMGGIVRFYLSTTKKETAGGSSDSLPDMLQQSSRKSNPGSLSLTSLPDVPDEPASTTLSLAAHGCYIVEGTSQAAEQPRP